MIIIEVFERGAAPGISRQLQPTASGSTPHNHVATPPVCSSLSLPLDQPRQSAFRYPPDVANRPTTCAGRRHLPLIHRLLHRRAACWTGPISMTRRPNPHSARGTTYVPLRAVSFLGGFRTPAAELAAPSRMRPASETYTDTAFAILMDQLKGSRHPTLGPHRRTDEPRVH
jgi:hypothetical protein